MYHNVGFLVGGGGDSMLATALASASLAFPQGYDDDDDIGSLEQLALTHFPADCLVLLCP